MEATCVAHFHGGKRASLLLRRHWGQWAAACSDAPWGLWPGSHQMRTNSGPRKPGELDRHPHDNLEGWWQEFYLYMSKVGLPVISTGRPEVTGPITGGVEPELRFSLPFHHLALPGSWNTPHRRPFSPGSLGRKINSNPPGCEHLEGEGHVSFTSAS